MRHTCIFLNILLIATIVAFASCGKQAESKPAIAVDSLEIMIDSLMTPEQKTLIYRVREDDLTEEERTMLKLLEDVIIEYMTVENNHFKFNLSKEDFVKKGLPIGFYYRIQKDVRDNNKFIDSMKLDAEEMLNKTIKEHNEALKL